MSHDVTTPEERARIAAQRAAIQQQYRLGVADTQAKIRDAQRGFDLTREELGLGLKRGLADVGQSLGARGLGWSGVRNAAEGRQLGDFTSALGGAGQQFQGQTDALQRALYKLKVEKNLAMRQLMAPIFARD